jgi:hypothetical protein
MAGNLSIARSKHASELRILSDRRDSVKRNIAGNAVSAGGFQRSKAETDALKALFDEISKTIAGLAGMDDAAILAKYDPCY